MKRRSFQLNLNVAVSTIVSFRYWFNSDAQYMLDKVIKMVF